MCHSDVFLVLFVLWGLINVISAAQIELTVDIQPGIRDCFHQYIEKDAEIEFEYQVLGKYRRTVLMTCTTTSMLVLASTTIAPSDRLLSAYRSTFT